MSKKKYISASAIRTYIDCPRKAVLDAAGLRKPSTSAQERGTQLHDAVERYLIGETGDTVPDELADHARTNGFLPEPADPLVLVEYGIGMPNRDAARYERVRRWTGQEVVVDGAPLRGIVDLVRLDRGRIEIWDHKTTSSWYWAETDETLRQNVQVWLYAELICRWLDDVDLLKGKPLTLGHIQYKKTKRPGPDDVRTVSFETSRAEVARKWGLIEDIARDLVADRDRLLRDVQPDTSACGNYGGCPHKGWCPTIRGGMLTPKQSVSAWKFDF